MHDIIHEIRYIQKSLLELAERIEHLEKRIHVKIHPYTENEPEKKETAFSRVVETIWKCKKKKGITIDEIAEKTGLEKKKISGVISRAIREGLIARVSRGVYKKV